MSSITVTRLDILGNVGTTNTAPVVLSQEKFESVAAAAASIRARGVPLTDSHAERIAAETQATVFSWREAVAIANSVAMIQVQYHVVAGA